MARSTTHRTPTEAAEPTAVERLLADPDLTQPLDVPGRPTGNGTPGAASSDGDGVQADPTHAVVGAFDPAVATVSAPPSPSAERTGSGRPTTFIPVDPELGKAMVALAEIAEHDHWAKTYQAHVDRVRWLHALAGRASAELADRRHVGAALWAELAAEAARWNGGGE